MTRPVIRGIDGWGVSVSCYVVRAGEAVGRCAWESRTIQFRRGFAWVVVGLLVFMLVATLLLEGTA